MRFHLTDDDLLTLTKSETVDVEQDENFISGVRIPEFETSVND